MAGARVAGLLAMLVAITAQPLGYSFLDVSRLRAHILNQGSKIDSIVPPPQDVDGVGLPVKMQIRVFKIISVDMPTATMRLQIWRRMKWKDTRLAWNETEFGGVWELRLEPGVHTGGAADSPDNNIWQPSLHMYNAATNPEETLESGTMWVYSDGSVFQSRPGFLDVSCRFTGLVNFPYDELSCPFDYGAWNYGDNVINMSFYENGGLLVDSAQETAGTSYQEYAIVRAATTTYTFTYACCPEPFTNLIFRLFFKRPQSYYFLAVELPGFLLTVVSMAVFWLDATNCGERLGFGVTMLLAIEVMKIVVSELLPVCGETLWIEILLFVNELWCAICILVSCTAIYQAYKGLGTIEENKSDRVDYWARRIVPSTYAVAIGVVYSITLDDGYMGSLDPMFQGLGKVNASGKLVIVPCVLVFIVGTFVLAKRSKCAERVKFLKKPVHAK